MNTPSRRNGLARRGISLVEYALAGAGVLLVVVVAVGQIGRTTSNQLNSTAAGISDPSELLQNPMLNGAYQPAASSGDNSSSTDEGHSASDSNNDSDSDSGDADADNSGNTDTGGNEDSTRRRRWWW